MKTSSLVTVIRDLNLRVQTLEDKQVKMDKRLDRQKKQIDELLLQLQVLSSRFPSYLP